MSPAAVHEIDAALVARLVAEQFPAWADLPVRAADPQGWDNRTFRLGSDLSVRLPSAAAYVPGTTKEQRVLTWLAGRLDVPVPEVVGVGRPGSGYPFPWSVRRWIDGTVASRAGGDRTALAADVGRALRQLRAVPTDGQSGLEPGAHSFMRGARPSVYADEVVDALATLGGDVDQAACRRVWDTACSTAWTGPGVWFHGDVAPDNLVVDDAGRLSALIDFGTSGVGDPACDVVLAWTFLDTPARQVFHRELALDDDTWARGRGWSLWKALVMIVRNADPDVRATWQAVLAATLADPVV